MSKAQVYDEKLQALYKVRVGLCRLRVEYSRVQCSSGTIALSTKTVEYWTERGFGILCQNIAAQRSRNFGLHRKFKCRVIVTWQPMIVLWHFLGTNWIKHKLDINQNHGILRKIIIIQKYEDRY